jgi:transcriptional regulator with XRE-family HTH domain
MLRLKLLRMEQELTQWEISHASEISQGRYSMPERGLIEATPEERERLAQILNASAATLFRPAFRVRQPRRPLLVRSEANPCYEQ